MNEKTQTGTRGLVPLSNQWSFRRDPVPVAWLKGEWGEGDAIVDLPHCWNERDTFQVGISYYKGEGAYGRRLDLPPAASPDDRWRLRSEGFYGTGELWINGRRTTRFDGQYLGLCEDVTSDIRTGESNTIGIRLTNAYQRFVLPGKKEPDFLLCGGLSGRMWLERLPAVHLDDRTLQVICDNVLTSRAAVRTTVHVVNTRVAMRSVRVRVSLVSPRGDVVAREESPTMELSPAGTAPVPVTLHLEQPERWDIDHPNLYRAEWELIADERVIDRAGTRFGVHEAMFDGKQGFFLNGRRLFLQGANRHEFMPGFGNALPDRLQRADAEQMKRIGLNFVRLAHYPQRPAFLDACDELGILVYAELATWKSVRPGPWARAAYRQLHGMLQRDRNHPSIILWGFGNESRSRFAYTKMARMAKELDPTRATIYAENHLHRGIRWRTLKLTDVLGINYELNRLDDAHALSKTGALLISEVSNCAYTQRGDEEAELKQIAAIERDLALLEDKPFVAGYALWCYADYASERRGRRRRRGGVVDAWRLPKMSASYMQARTAQDLFVAVHGNWAIAAGATERQLHIFSNADELVISIGGVEAPRIPAQRHVTWRGPFQEAELVVTACRGAESVEARLIPHGPAKRLLLEPDKPTGSASDRETMGVTLKAVDAQGRPARDCEAAAMLSGVGPGRIRHFAAANIVEMAAGIGRFFVTGTGETGVMNLECQVDGLEPAEASIEYA